MTSQKSKIGKPVKLNVLLLEPNYKNKYPPIGLMKISTYHKMQGHYVRFFKGDLNKLLLTVKITECVKALRRIGKGKPLMKARPLIETYLKHRRLNVLKAILLEFPKKDRSRAEDILRHHCCNIPKNHWDRIYITTLFTFYWDITIDTIEFAKKIVDIDRIKVGGVMASLLKEEIHTATGIQPNAGLLNAPGMLDSTNDIIVDNLVLDYSILGEIEYQYPTQSAYFTYMTKGCTRKCAFCSVPKLEPTYTPKIPALDLFAQVKDKFGDQRNLMLMDNNVLASPMFPEIVEEIKQMGFTKDAVFIEPNQLDITIKNLKAGVNDDAYIKRSLFLMNGIRKKLRGEMLLQYDSILDVFGLMDATWADKKAIMQAYKLLKSTYDIARAPKPKKRYVDFNQGVDARYVTEENMTLMGQIPIKPLRIAFDHIGIKSTYIKAVELAAKHGIRDLSNYILYNFQDKPVDFYGRIKINVDLGKRLGVVIFSFPMKYVPLFGEEAKDRKYVGKHWNKKYLRAIQCILNSTKGIVAAGYDFFQMSFGSTYKEFEEILIMPESYIVNRNYFENNGLTEKWKSDLNSLSSSEREIAMSIILSNDFEDITTYTANPKVLRLLSHYSTKSSKDRIFVDTEVKKLRKKFNSLIRRNLFVELTLTHDFENRKIAATV